MAKYTANFPGYGDLEIDSGDTTLSEEQLNSIAQEQLKSRIAENPEPATQPDFITATSRRVMEAGKAAMDIPSNLYNLVSGGDQSGRLSSALKLVQGVASPISILTAPVEGATEAAAGTLIPPEYAKLAGDVSGLVGTMGIGLLAKAGKLGAYGLRLAEVLGVGRAGQTLEEAAKHDPHLAAIIRMEGKGDVERPLEELARTSATTEELAMGAKSPQLAENFLKQKQIVGDQWMEWAKTNKVIGEEPPASAVMEAAKGLEFSTAKRGDLGIFGTLGTPTTRALALNPELAGPAAIEMTLREAKINKGITAREARNADAIVGLTSDEVRQAVIMRQSEIPFTDLMKLPETKLNANSKRILSYINDKLEVDRQIIIPRLKDEARASLTRQVTKEMTRAAKQWGEEVDKATVKSKVEERLKGMKLEDWGLEDYITRIWPGRVRIIDDKGNLMGAVENGMQARYAIRDLVAENPSLSGKLTTKTSSYFDSDLLHTLKGRVSRQYKSLAEGIELSPDDIIAAEKGNFGPTGKPKFNPFLLERQGKAKGYSEDFLTILNSYDRVTERWSNLSDLSRKVAPVIDEINKKGQPYLAWMLESTLKQAWGFKSPISGLFDSTIANIPVLRDIVAPGALDRMTQVTKLGIVNAFLRWSVKFQTVNATQILQTLWPVADASDIARGIALRGSQVGKDLIEFHGISRGSVVESFAKGLGPTERANQEVAFLTMYNKARQWGLTDKASADYGLVRGNIYSQFLGLVTDQPVAFQKAKFLAPLDMFTMFQRFPIKQAEIMIDLIKDKNFPGAAKWLGVNLVMGGFKAATFGQAGWLTYKLYKDIEKEYGKTTADLFHNGLPSLVGVDVSSSVQLFNPPFGDSWGEKVGNFLGGVVGSTVGSTLAAAFSSSAVEPEMGKRAFNAFVDRVPLAKSLSGLVKLYNQDYDFKDPLGRLRWKGDAKDAIKQVMGFRQGGGVMGMLTGAAQMRPAELDTFVDSLLEVETKRNEVINYAASRYGSAMLAGVDLGPSLQEAVEKEVAQWNALWPDFPISGSDINGRAKSRNDSALQSLGQRILSSAPRVIRESDQFFPSGGD